MCELCTSSELFFNPAACCCSSHLILQADTGGWPHWQPLTTGNSNRTDITHQTSRASSTQHFQSTKALFLDRTWYGKHNVQRRAKFTPTTAEALNFPSATLKPPTSHKGLQQHIILEITPNRNPFLKNLST